MKIKLIGSVSLLFMMVGCSIKESKISKSRTVESPPTISSIPMVDLTPQQKEILEAHNIRRHHYFSDSDLLYSKELEREAQRYANVLAQSGEFKHDPRNKINKYGENLYSHSQHEPITIEEAIQHWYDEEKPLYNYEDGTCQEKHYKNGQRISCGHYTQVIWQETREVGCANAQYQKGDLKGGYIYVCKYKEAGNKTINGKKEKPYCQSYSKKDINLDNAPLFSHLNLRNQTYPITLIDEDRVNCKRRDTKNSAIQFNGNLSKAIVKNFQIFNDGKYPNTLEFNDIKIHGRTMILRGENSHNDTYKNSDIFMTITLLGETPAYYAVELSWNGIDERIKPYNRRMKAKLYK